jgi:hypothetical protein
MERREKESVGRSHSKTLSPPRRRVNWECAALAMFSSSPRQGVRIEHIDAEAERLISYFGVEAYAEARRREYESSDAHRLSAGTTSLWRLDANPASASGSRPQLGSRSMLFSRLISLERAEKVRMASGPAQPFEKAGFTEGNGLDFPSPKLGFSFLLLGFSFPRFAQNENSAAAGGLAPTPPRWSPAKWERGTPRRAVEGARHKRGDGFADLEGWSSKSKAA